MARAELPTCTAMVLAQTTKLTHLQSVEGHIPDRYAVVLEVGYRTEIETRELQTGASRGQ